MYISDEFKINLIKSLPKLRRVGRGILLKYGLNPDQCDDYVQDTVCVALSRADKYEEGTNMVGWLLTIFTNCALNQVKRERTRRSYLSMQEKLVENDFQQPTQSDNLRFEEITEVFDSLPKEMRTILNLVCFQGRSYKETAELLGTNVGTIKSRASRAKQEFAKAMRQKEKKAEVQACIGPRI